jgi:hypothetical protein
MGVKELKSYNHSLKQQKWSQPMGIKELSLIITH